MLNRIHYALVGRAVRKQILNVVCDISGLFQTGRLDKAEKLRFDSWGTPKRSPQGSPPRRCPIPVVLLKPQLKYTAVALDWTRVVQLWSGEPLAGILTQINRSRIYHGLEMRFTPGPGPIYPGSLGLDFKFSLERYVKVISSEWPIIPHNVRFYVR